MNLLGYKGFAMPKVPFVLVLLFLKLRIIACAVEKFSLCARNSKTHLLSDFTPKWLSFLQVSHFIRIKGVLLGDLP